ncbi:MAG: hypothetical protein JNL51_10855 [Chitinophagaceae bacterium]|nr:hypothetical protein [Chitinophagaceae bacterium]
MAIYCKGTDFIFNIIENSPYFSKKYAVLEKINGAPLSCARKMMLIFFFLSEIQICLSQEIKNIKDILLQVESPSVSVRKFSIETGKHENYIAWYSATHNEILLNELSFKRFPDSYYHILKARFTAFKGIKFNDDSQQMFIRIEYYVLDSNEKRLVNCACIPRSEIKAVKDIRKNEKNELVFVIDDESEWILEDNDKSERSIFYVKRSKNTALAIALDHTVMLTNLKWLVVRGEKAN